MTEVRTITSKRRTRCAATCFILGLAVTAAAGCQREAPVPLQGPVPVNEAEVKALADFQDRVNAYVALHRKIEAELPAVPNDATPQQIDARQRELGKRIMAARATAVQGDLLTPAMQALVRNHFVGIFKAKDGGDVKGSILDENPVDMKIAVNQRYPDEVPLSTMPPEVLELLPKMPEELKYRFVSRHLVIMDAHAHLIADFVTNAIPN